MRQFEIQIPIFTPFGFHTFKAYPEININYTVTFSVYDKGEKIHSLKCYFGDPTILDKIFDFIKKYVESPEFEQNRKEGGAWN